MLQNVDIGDTTVQIIECRDCGAGGYVGYNRDSINNIYNEIRLYQYAGYIQKNNSPAAKEIYLWLLNIDSILQADASQWEEQAKRYFILP